MHLVSAGAAIVTGSTRGPFGLTFSFGGRTDTP